MTKLQDFLNSPITRVARLARAAKAGDLFGFELECEGRNVDWDGTPGIIADWAPHADGSLRANHGSACEWVFNGPVKIKTAEERVSKLFKYFEGRRAKLVTSNRTSTHVHFNMSDKNAYQLVNMFILFTILEDILDRYCGDDRRGNLFCLSSRHAEEQVRWVMDACFKNYSFNYREDQRYTSFNMAAINKFGSVEFRGMRGLDNEADALAWLSILDQFCDFACYKMRNPVTVLEQISAKTPIGFLKEVFNKDNFARLTKGVDDYAINQSVYEGLRLVQMLCYKIGTEFDQVRLKGKDFWSSFSDDVALERDVDPENFEGPRGGRIGGARRNPFPRLDPAVPQPIAPLPGAFNLARAVEREQIRRREEARAAARADREVGLPPVAGALRPKPVRVRPLGADERPVERAPVQDPVNPEWWQPLAPRGEENEL